ncbi:MAG: TlpA family protein disulfide reductase [Candidatus Levybacteria bacterium]|nr:TlpA family protein disulfide reductase [Candidatus Levybacteria bacterium]
MVKITSTIIVIAVVVLGLLTTDVIKFGESSSETKVSSQVQTAGLSIGDKAPDFTLTTIDGVNLTQSNLQGKILVITSGAAWCPTCIIENKNFNPVFKEVKDKGVEFITVDIDPIDDEVAIAEFQRLYAPWHNVSQENAKKMIEDYGFWRFEITYIVDREGIIRFKDGGITSTETLRNELGKLI